jgi:hypothetical protein
LLCGVPAIFTAHGWAFTEGIPESRRRLYISQPPECCVRTMQTNFPIPTSGN